MLLNEDVPLHMTDLLHDVYHITHPYITHPYLTTENTGKITKTQHNTHRKAEEKSHSDY